MRARKRLLSKFIVAVLTLLGSVALVAGPLWASAPTVAPVAGPSPLSKAQVARDYGRLPLFFTENQGQVDSQVKFYTQGPGHGIFFTPEGMFLSLSRAADEAKRSGKKNDKGKGNRELVQLRPQGIRSGVEILATEPLPGKVNYYQGNDPAKWRTEVPTYKSVLYREAYPGIDLKFYGAGQQVEYDLIVKPGADPKQVKFLYQGIKALKVTQEGDLIITLPGGGNLVQKKPVIYQEINSQRVSREGKFRLLPDKRGYGFDLASYDTRYPLIIDPVVLNYSNYLGGNTWESGNGIALDPFGNAYVVGTTYSTNFPLAGPPGLRGTSDAFIAKFNPSGSALLYATYLGGANDDPLIGDMGLAIAVDATGAAYVTGETSSPTFPLSATPLQSTFNAVSNAFVTKFNPAGVMAYSTYLGGTKTGSNVAGTASDVGQVIAVDGAGIIYVAGQTNSIDFPPAGGGPIQATLNGKTNVFIAKINPNSAGTAGLLYTTYLGGSVSEAVWGIAVNTAGTTIYVAGETQSSNFPISASPFQGTNKGTSNAFISKINPSVAGNAGLLYSTYLGGSAQIIHAQFDISVGGDDSATGGISIDTTGNAYVAGNTDSLDFPTTAGSFQRGMAAYIFSVAGVNTKPTAGATYTDGTTTFTVVSTSLSGPAGSLSGTITVSVVSLPAGTPSPTPNGGGSGTLTRTGGVGDLTVAYSAWDTALANNAFVAKFNSAGNLVYATYLGGSGVDIAWFIKADAFGNAYVTGQTASIDFPVRVPFQTGLNGAINAFVSKLYFTGASLGYSTYLGGNAADYGFGITLDSFTTAYVTGQTTSSNFPTHGTFQPTPPPGSAASAFVTKVTGGSNLIAEISILVLDF